MRTYRTLLRGDHLEWLEEKPASQTDAPLHVHVTVLEPESPSEVYARGHAMAALLEKLTERRTFSTIPDPVKWQRELRRDRVLPGREEGCSSIAISSSMRPSQRTPTCGRSSPRMRQLFLLSATWRSSGITSSMTRSGNIWKRSFASRRSCPSREPSLIKQWPSANSENVPR